ncbi:two-component regulator propeller domain-containing protein [uncultured Bacteroides sp.]|uniref:hybrid sensor histidine kinase/response regulator n=1 Tax=uncultured Bacteroides sp. TaxID=162156 RepID=UPI002AA89DF5|nr:two-component regulator propeller domain-containing protein [uncultured Bacteroides sp.]
MKQIVIRLFFCCLFGLSALPFYSQDVVHYYLKTLDIRNGLSQNTVNAILQDRQGFMWFGTKDGLNRFDGLSFRIFKREESGLGNNFITALHEDQEGNIWIGTDAGVYVYNPILENFSKFNKISNTGNSIKRAVTMIQSDGNGDIWISADNEGLFHYDRRQNCLWNYLRRKDLSNVTRFWFEGNTCWLSLYADNLYHTDIDFKTALIPFRNNEGKEVFKNDIINTQVNGPHNCIYIGSSNGLTEVNLTTCNTRRLLGAYVRTLQFKSDQELWAGTESGLYIYDLIKNKVTHLSVPYQEDSYALSDNAIYSLCCDKEEGMWIGSYFGGVNYYPKQWTYFEKFYPRDDIKNFGRRVREFCESNDGTLWIGTEDKGLFHFDPISGEIKPFEHPAIYKNIHGLCLDGNDLWVGTFSGGLNRINLRTKQVKHYQKGEATNSMNANDAFSICKTTTGDLWIGTTSGLLRYNRRTDDFTRIPQLTNVFVYNILEDFNGNLWLATYSNGVFRYDVHTRHWKNFISQENDSTSLPYNKVISIYEDSRKRLWFMTQGAGFCRYNPETESFSRYDTSKGFPSNIVYKMVEDNRGNLWITTGNGLVCFNPETNGKHVYTTANGLLSNQFNYQSGYRDKKGRIYFGSINGFIVFDPETFIENSFIPPVVLTDFFLFNKRLSVASQYSPLKKSITYSDEIILDADQNSFSFHAAALSYQAPEMNQLVYKLEGFDREWHSIDKSALISYSNLAYGTYTFRLKGSNSDGKWNGNERILKIRIHPPFYLSPLAYSIYAVIFLFSIAGIIYYFREKTLRKHQRAMDIFEREKERELYAAKIDFFTNVAHEIRTPLTLIKSPLENVLSSKHVAGEIRDDLEMMDLNTTRLLDLVNQLLDFRKTETKEFQLNFVECNVSVILQKTYMRFTSLMRQKGLELTVDCPDNIHASVDKEGLTKIISNLLANAVKYADTYVKVKLLQEDALLQLSVYNDGELIPLTMREEIFKPFVQYKGGNLRSVSGTGIGLALARSLAELHGGSLCMDQSTECNCFILTFPMKHKHTIAIIESENESLPIEMDSEAEKYNVEGNDNSERKSRYTLLVVEDNFEMLSFVAKQLSGDYVVLTAGNGMEALDVLKDRAVSLIISDIVMPEMDGLELCDHLKSELDYSHIPIILLTAKTTLQSKIEGLKLGADAYIEKPFSVEYLKVCVSNLLTNREKLRASFVHSPFVQTNTMAMTKADEAFLRNLKEVIIENMQDPDFSLDDMASLLNMSRSSLNRKIKGVLDMTPNDYIRLERLKRAAQLLKEGECKINEICYMVGFNTPSYFTKCFLKQFGSLPKDFRG